MVSVRIVRMAPLRQVSLVPLFLMMTLAGLSFSDRPEPIREVKVTGPTCRLSSMYYPNHEEILKGFNSMTTGDLLQEIKKGRSPHHYRLYQTPLDVVFLIDQSTDFVKWAPSLLSIMEDLKNEYPGSRFGMSYFSDFTCTDRHSAEECRELVQQKKHHTNPEGCYTFNTSLTPDTVQLEKNAKEIPSLPSSDFTAGIAGLLLTLTDKKMGWDSPTEQNRLRIVFIATSANTSCCGKPEGVKNFPRLDGSDKCLEMDDPQPELVGQIMRDKEIYLFIAIEQHKEADLDNCDHWSAMGIRTNTPFDLMVLNDGKNNAAILERFRDFLLRLIYTDGVLDYPNKERTTPRVLGFRGLYETPFSGAWVKDPTAIYVPNFNQMLEINGMTSEQVRREVENAKPTKKYKLYKAPLDVVFLIDNSVSMDEETFAFMEKLDDLTKEYPGSRFGMSAFSDFSEDKPDSCYAMNTALAPGIASVQSSVQTIIMNEEAYGLSGRAALMMTAMDPQLGWDTAMGEGNRIRVVFVVATNFPNWRGKNVGVKNKAKGDGSDKCSEMDDPDADFVGKLLRKRKIKLFLVVKPWIGLPVFMDDDNGKKWSKLSMKMRVPCGLVDSERETDPGKIIQQFRDFLLRIIYAEGFVEEENTLRAPPLEKMKANRKMTMEGKQAIAKQKEDKKEPSQEEIRAALQNAKPPTCYRDPGNPIDLVFVIDHSSKDVLVTAQRVLLGIVDEIKQEYKGTQFGLTFYSDFMCSDWTEIEECPGFVEDEWDHDDPEGCYTFKFPLGTDVHQIKKAPAEMKVLPSINTEAGMAALMMTASDPHVNWPSVEMSSRNRVAFVITNDGSHCCGKHFGIQNPPKGDGTDKCVSMDNPTPEFVGGILRGKGISVFLAGGNEKAETGTFENWSGMASRMNVTFGMANTDEDSNAEVLRKFRRFMDKVVYYEGTVPCS